jgi:hypothetical protein
MAHPADFQRQDGPSLSEIGGVAEWLIAPDLRSGEPLGLSRAQGFRGFESRHLLDHAELVAAGNSGQLLDH